MKTLKLEVGKIYRSREGEEVRIISKGRVGRWPCQGSNGKWYTESGRWYDFDEEDPENLIEEVEEVLETRHTFAIPDGVKEITLDYFGNRIVVEMVPEEGPKPGDVMVTDWNSVYIFKSNKYNEGYHTCFAWLGESGNLSIGDWCLPGRPATPEEAKPLFDALKKAGKRWNPETMQVEEIPESTRIRVWMNGRVPDGYYTYQGIADVIENYLKHREGKK